MSAGIETWEGGCLCGRVRYRARGKPWNASHCHCELCRRASGAAFVSWATFTAEGFAFTQGEPVRYRSSDIATRQFCGHCGTQLTFQFDASPQSIDVTLASLDQPGAVVPADHIWTRRQLPWIQLADGLPRYEQSRPDKS